MYYIKLEFFKYIKEDVIKFCIIKGVIIKYYVL